MKKVITYYKRYLPVILFIVALLWLRAQGELNLPDYTSRIVDIGISRFGIESIVPDKLRPETFESLLGQVPLYFSELFSESYTFTYDRYVFSGEEAAREALEPVLFTLIGFDFLYEEYTALGVDMGRHQIGYIMRVGGAMLLVLLLVMGCIILETFFSARMAAGIAQALRSDIFKKVVSFSNSEFDKFSTASLITRSTNDVQQIQMISFLFLRFVVFTPMLGVGAVFRVVGAGSEMTAAILVSVLATLVFVTVIFKLVTPKFKIMQKLIDRLNLVTRESLTGLMVVRAFNREKYEEEKFDTANKNLRNLNIFVNRVFAFMNPVMMLVLNFTTLVIIWVGASLVQAGNLQVGMLFAFLQYVIMIVTSFMMMTMIVANLPRALVSINRISEVLTTEPSINDHEITEKFEKNKSGTVEFRNVSFKYPDAEEYALRDVSFTAKPGEMTAFIGSTGSGKSTVAHLLQRFYDVTEGEVLVEGADVRKVGLKDLRRKIGYVPQKALLFSGTIGTNIKYASADGNIISDEDMRQAAEIAQSADFIDEKPEKYDDEISQAGANVSGGQKQRISIARAIAKKPGIYIFDDSFSALDYKTDAALRRALSEKLGGATLLVVAQRIGTIKNAEQIIVLEHGKMAGKGTHEELLKNCEVYRQIALSQLSEEELALGGGAV